ncbi:MAG: hypothetical protein K8T25_21740 [Planctomycetia bacterium]|nr:hypothetical protein [Planctomycetia bacterium]
MNQLLLTHPGPLAAAFVVCGFLAASGVAAAGAPTAKSPAPREHAQWEKEIQAYEAADAKSPPPQGAILFTGASGIRMWKSLAKDFPDQKVINRGFGGSGIGDAVYFADRIVIPCKPRLIVLQAGGNDIHAGKSPEYVFEQFKAFVDKVHAALPETRIAYLSMNPSPARWSEREKQQQGNALIQKYIAEGKNTAAGKNIIAGKNLDYIDFWPALLSPDGKPREELFIKDHLHNNAAGYAIRADVVRPHLK